jgi:hypothetical protein
MKFCMIRKIARPPREKGAWLARSAVRGYQSKGVGRLTTGRGGQARILNGVEANQSKDDRLW